MKAVVLALACLVALLVAGGLVWRALSTRVQLPCPTWLAWSLDNRIIGRFLGTRSTLDRMGLRDGQHVLEIGPGSGRLLIEVARRVGPTGAAVGVDIQPGMIERLERSAAKAGVANVRGIVADATRMDLPEEILDVVFIALTLGEIPAQSEALRRAHHVLKPGGMLSVTELFPDPHFVPRGRVRKLAEDAGFVHSATLGGCLYFTANFVKPEAPDRVGEGA